MVRIFLDTADISVMSRFGPDKRIEGFTTNPALMRKAGIGSYRNFATIVLGIADGRPLSLEVTADDFDEMERQARHIYEWGSNIWIKIPITNTRGESCLPCIKRMSDMRLNITAVMTREQIDSLAETDGSGNIVSVFAGRIADTGRDPKWTMRHARDVLKKSQLLWASTREVLNVYQAEESGADIITLTPDLIGKLGLHGKNLAEYSLETVKGFHEDGKGISL